MRYSKKQVAILRPESRKTTACLALIATAPIDKPGTEHCLFLCAIEVGDLLDSVKNEKISRFDIRKNSHTECRGKKLT